MGMLSDFLQLHRRGQLRARADCDDPSDRAKSDAIHLWTITSKSQLNRIVTADISQPANRVEARYCLEFLAFYAGVPAYLSGGVDHDDFDYKVTRCGACSGPDGDHFFDANGDHTAACSNAHATRCYTHRTLAGVVQDFATEAGFKVTREPSTEVILSSLGEAGRLKNLLPTKRGKVAQAAQKEAEAKLEGIRSASDPALKQALAREALKCLPTQAEDQPSLRGDLLVEDALGRRPSKLLDLTAPHDSCKTLRRGQYNHLLRAYREEAGLFEAGLIGAVPGESYACAQTSKKKHAKYHIVEVLANIQASAFGVNRPLKFAAAVMTHRGELSPEFMDFIEVCAARFKSLRRAMPDGTGYSPSQAATSFRNRFKTALCCQMARGFGRQLVATRVMGACAGA
jgi:hypothetical protein